MICPETNKAATVYNVAAICVLLISGCASDEPIIERTYITRENYKLATKSVTPLNNGISQAPTVKQPVLVGLNDDEAQQAVASSVYGNIAKWAVYEKPYPTPAYTEGIAGAGMRDGIIETVYFPRGSSEFSDLPELKILAKKLTLISGQLTLIGYTDTSEHRSLGLERAKNVAEELKALGVPEDRISVKNGGATRLYSTPSKDRCVNVVLKVK